MQNNKPQRPINAEYVIDWVWGNRSKLIGSMPVDSFFIMMLTLLYSIHKGYRLTYNNRLEFAQHDDALLRDLVNSLPTDLCIPSPLQKLYHELVSDIQQDEFSTFYPDVLKGMFDLMSQSIGKSWGEFYTPAGVSRLMAYIVKKHGCRTVYDPFCGTASIACELARYGDDIHFEGQEINSQTALYARLNLDAVYGDDSHIKTCDSLLHWNDSHFDAVVTCPPLGMRLPRELAMESPVSRPTLRGVEEETLIRSLYKNKADLTVTLMALGFCINVHSYELRRFLIENNQIDTIISLAKKILYGTSISCIILVCKQTREPDEPIKFIHAEDCFIGDRRTRTFDFDRYAAMVEGDESGVTKVWPDTIRKFDYNLNPSLYKQENLELKEGQQLVRLEELISPVEGERVSDADAKAITVRNLGKVFIDVLLNNGKTSAALSNGRPYYFRTIRPSAQKYLLVSWAIGENRYGINTGGKGFIYTRDVQVYRVNENLTSPEYLAYVLLKHEALNTTYRIRLSEFMDLSIAIDSREKQEEIVGQEIRQYEQRINAEREADAARLGIKQHVSDLEHMLGSTQLRISKIIARLENATPSTDNYQHLVKSLKDNVEYLNRVIKYKNTRIDFQSFNLKEGDITEFVNNYVDSWKNYGGEYFELETENMLSEAPKMSFDKTMLTVMLDSVLNNAIRHGFHKRKNHTDRNTVQISTCIVEYQGRPYVLLSVSNNGDPMADGFTIDDYISRGRYTASTGRSGLGGHHVYQIAKGHHGYLYLDSNKVWNMIVEVLLPVETSNVNEIPVYENECI